MLDYYPYGDTRLEENSVDYENDYKFTGKEKDKETGLYYYESRYYDSSLARFASVDPWSGDLSDPQSLNKYSYVRNNPVKYVDPSGEVYHLAIPAILGIAGFISGTEEAYSPSSVSNSQALQNAPQTMGERVATAIEWTSIAGIVKQSVKGGIKFLGKKTLSPIELNRTHSIEGMPARRNVDYQKEQILQGNETPIEFVKIKGHKYITDGHHRTQAYKELGQKMPVKKRSVNNVVSDPRNSYKSVSDIVESSANSRPNKLPKSPKKKKNE